MNQSRGAVDFEIRRSTAVLTMLNAEISFDLIMNDDMRFVEGTYRLAGEDCWRVFVSLRRDIPEPYLLPVTWNLVSGLNIIVPNSTVLNAAFIQRIMGEYYNVDQWIVVRGPDSMALRS